MTTPTSTKDTYSKIVYGADVMIPVEINTPTWRREHFNEKENDTWLRCTVKLLDEAWDIAHIQEYVAKQMDVRICNSRVVLMDMK